MADSKTARASQVRVVKEVHVETTEEAIKAIRDNRAAGLFIGDMSRVDKLLQAHDAAIADIKAREASAAARMEMSKFLPLLKELAENPTFIEKINEAGFVFDAVELVEVFETFAQASGWKFNQPLVVKMKDVDCEHGDQT